MRADTKRLERERSSGHGWGAIRPVRWEAIAEVGPSSLLDVGCSTGGYVRSLEDSGVPATGLDVLPHAEWHRMTGRYLVGEAADLPFADSSFEAVVAFETLEHLADAERALAEWRRVSARHLIVSVPNCESPYWARSAGLNFQHYIDRTHVNFYTQQSLETALVGAGYVIERLEPILPINPYVPALAALGLPRRIVEGVGRRLDRFVRHRWHGGLLAVARVR